MSDFSVSHAWVVGIDAYQGDIPALKTAVADAQAIAALLKAQQGYDRVTVRTNAEASLAALITDLEVTLPGQIGDGDRLFIYFAGHGIAQDGDDGPEGFLVPQDADGLRPSLLPMSRVATALKALRCRHLMVVLDCCFAGAFRWSSLRNIIPKPRAVYRHRYARFVQHPAAQVLTSAAADQTALDTLSGLRIGRRPVEGTHSPFAAALMRGLQGEADLPGADGRTDGVITATELYQYVRDVVEVAVTQRIGRSQTPGLWPLPQHGRGEFLFSVPGVEPRLLEDPRLDAANNPWRGLRPYTADEASLYVGRDADVAALTERLGRPGLVAVVGPSGAGKSSCVGAGVVPRLITQGVAVLGPLRPGDQPMTRLAPLWARPLPPNTVAVIDQLDELFTVCFDEAARRSALAGLADYLAAGGTLLVSLRTDLEGAFEGSPLGPALAAGRYPLAPIPREGLREIVLVPAEQRVLYFEPPSLVDTLVDAVADRPGGLPLLSFALSELYRHSIERGDGDRALTSADLAAIGGVTGALRQRAEAIYAEADADTRDTLRRLMLRLVRIAGPDRTRRQVTQAELTPAVPAEAVRLAACLDALTARHLVVRGGSAGAGVVEVAHDALLTDWDRLDGWIDADELPVQRTLWQAAEAWRAGGEARAQLWHDDPRRARAESLPDVALNTLERDFLVASAAWALTRKRRLRTAVGVAVVLLLGIGAFAWIQRDGRLAEAARSAAATAKADRETIERLEADALRAMEAQLAVAPDLLSSDDPDRLLRGVRLLAGVTVTHAKRLPEAARRTLAGWAQVVAPDALLSRALRPNVLERGGQAWLMMGDGQARALDRVPDRWFALPGGQVATLDPVGRQLDIYRAGGQPPLTIALAPDWGELRGAALLRGSDAVVFELVDAGHMRYQIHLLAVDLAAGTWDVATASAPDGRAWGDCTRFIGGKQLAFGPDGKLKAATVDVDAVDHQATLATCARALLPSHPVGLSALNPIEPAWRRWSREPVAGPEAVRLGRGERGLPVDVRARLRDGPAACRPLVDAPLLRQFAAGRWQATVGIDENQGDVQLGVCLAHEGAPITRAFGVPVTGYRWNELDIAARVVPGTVLTSRQLMAVGPALYRVPSGAPLPIEPTPTAPISLLTQARDRRVLLRVADRLALYTGDDRLSRARTLPPRDVRAAEFVGADRLLLQTGQTVQLTDDQGAVIWQRRRPDGVAEAPGRGLALNEAARIVAARWGDAVVLYDLDTGAPRAPAERPAGLLADEPAELAVGPDGAVRIYTLAATWVRRPATAPSDAQRAALAALPTDLTGWVLAQAKAGALPVVPAPGGGPQPPDGRCPPGARERDGACWVEADPRDVRPAPGAPVALERALPWPLSPFKAAAEGDSCAADGPFDRSRAAISQWIQRLARDCRPGGATVNCGKLPNGLPRDTRAALDQAFSAAVTAGPVVRHLLVQQAARWLGRCHGAQLRPILAHAQAALAVHRRLGPTAAPPAPYRHAVLFIRRRIAQGLSAAEQQRLLDAVVQVIDAP